MAKEDINERIKKLRNRLPEQKIIETTGKLHPSKNPQIIAEPPAQRPIKLNQEQKNNLEERMDAIYLDLLKRTTIHFDSEKKYYQDAEALLKEMSEASFEYGKPISSSWNGTEFVIEARSSHKKACEAWVEQTFDLKHSTFEELNMFSTGDFLVNSPEKGVLYEAQDRKIAEAILVNYPEKADTLNTIQLHGVYLSNFGNNKGTNAESLLRKSIDDYMSGKETFKPNIYNVAQLSDVREFAFKTGMYSLEDLDKRIAQTQKDMLATLDDRRLKYLSDDALLFVSQIAEKHPEDETAKGIRQTTQGLIIQRNKEKSKHR